MPNLSKRLLTIASLVPFGARVCDIGADHGYLSIFLATHKNPLSVITTDINEKPLSRARKNIEKASINNIDLRLCDGLSGIKPYEADTVIIAGMGGEIISGILERGESVVKNSGINIILQPTTSPEYLRKYLCKNGFEIIKEIPVLENSKLYSIMLIRHTGIIKEYPEYFYYTGLLTPETDEGYLYIKKQYDRCSKCAESLKNTDKTEQFDYYKSVSNGINSYLREYKNGI